MTDHADERFRFALRELRGYLERSPELCTAADYRRARAAVAAMNRCIRGNVEDSQNTDNRASGRSAC